MAAHSRPYGEALDLDRMSALVTRAWSTHGPRSEFALGDLDWRMWRSAEVDPQHNLRLWEGESGDLLGFAWLNTNGLLDLLVHPRSLAAHLVPDMLQWAEARARAMAPEGGVAPRVVAWALASNEALGEAMAAHGYSLDGSTYLNLWRHTGDVPTLDLPEGYAVRSVEGAAEAGARAAAHRAAFGTARVSEEVYRMVMAARHYRSDLDLVAVAPDGSFAATALVWLDPAHRCGLFEPVGTHPDHRRRGLAAALLAEGLRRLSDLGATGASVSSLPANTGSVDLYRTLAFEEIDRNRGWSRVVPPLGTRSAPPPAASRAPGRRKGTARRSTP